MPCNYDATQAIKNVSILKSPRDGERCKDLIHELEAAEWCWIHKNEMDLLLFYHVLQCFCTGNHQIEFNGVVEERGNLAI